MAKIALESLLPKKNLSNSSLLRSFTFLKKYRGIALGVYGLALVTNGLAVLIPQTIRWIVDAGIVQRDMRILLAALVGLLLLSLGKGGVDFVLGRWTEVASQGVAYDIRNAIFEKLSSLSFSYHDRAQTGQLLARSISDVERIRFLTGRAILRLFQSSTLMLLTFAALLLMNPLLALLSMLLMPLMAYVAFRFGRIYRPLSLDLQHQLAEMTTALEQNLRGAKIVKAFAQEDAEVARFDAKNQHWADLAARQVRVAAKHIPLLDFIASLSTVVIIWLGGRLVIEGGLSLGELVAFTTYLGQLVSPVRRLGIIVPAVAMASAAGERIYTILDAQSEVVDAPDALPLPPIKGQVRFEKVAFAYFDQRPVLDGLSFSAQAGEVVALLGATGSGKSTIINLIPRFYDVTGGRILVDGHDLRDVTLNSLRDQIGIVLQESVLFAASIHENIAFGLDVVTDAEVIEAAKAAQAHDFIMQMPDGYATEVGERGVTLSGGQKQRIAIARALLKDPRILLLDDATSSVDTETERLIQLALERLMQGRTAFIIAQRLSTVRLADKVLVLQGGRVAAAGTHTELLRSSSLYAEIYHRNLRA
ncbi:MAG: ABC transporter ATP-binding protein [Chloroflexi bacterium]|nr:ABC transporter ATP-binding protein [Chloroflexota bacterium]MCY3583969.1 ABC transporter ATP-binding protein [Chloroflexota bacterium]MCY3717708.1 ABC transporter ATP-binding protein [Chloroflexota bacterium]MDE2649286.1 ABC transporter ATP-binding protein [Chloroflexota bacterium]MXX50606.1 ABC transporter ATP-binding protein [Chloroflexota bacterium]